MCIPDIKLMESGEERGWFTFSPLAEIYLTSAPALVRAGSERHHPRSRRAGFCSLGAGSQKVESV
jgi:hypothetical protein